MIEEAIDIVVWAEVDVGRKLVAPAMFLTRETVYLDVITIRFIELFADPLGASLYMSPRFERFQYGRSIGRLPFLQGVL